MYKALDKILLSNSIQQIKKLYLENIFNQDVNSSELKDYLKNKQNEEKIIILAIINNKKIGEEYIDLIKKENYFLTNIYGFNIFHYIGIVNNIWILSWLKKSEKINEKNIYEIPPLYLCENKELIKMMIDYGADINMKKNLKQSLNYFEFTKENNEELIFLIENGADINIQDNDGDTPVMIATINNNLEVVEILLKNKANPNIKNNLKETPLNIAARMGYIDILKKLIQNGAIDSFGFSGDTVLMEACHHGNYEIVKYLLENNIVFNINAVNTEGFTALMKAIEFNQLEIVQLLVKNNVNLLITDDKGWNCLSWALSNYTLNKNKQSFEILKFLIINDLRLIYLNENNRQDVFTMNLFKAFIDNKHSDYIKNIYENISEILRTENTFEELNDLISNNDLCTLKKRLNNGIDINIKGIGNRTLLMTAMSTKNEEISKYLIENKINLNETNFMNVDILSISSNIKNINIFQELINLGINIKSINNVNNDGWGVIHFAVKNENIDYIKEVLKLGANINTATNDGRTPLYLACSDNKIDIVKILVENGANLEIPDNEGNTPFQLALEYGSIEICEYLLDAGVKFKYIPPITLKLICMKNKKLNLLTKIQLLHKTELEKNLGL